jgi:CRP-like cAMP-binding protein
MMKVKYVGARQILLQEGDRGTEMFVFVEGTAEIVSEIDNSKVVGHVGPGDFVGDMAVVLREQQVKCVVTTADCTVRTASHSRHMPSNLRRNRQLSLCC